MDYQIAMPDQPICHTVAQGMTSFQKNSNKKSTPHTATLMLYLGLVNKGSSTTGFWSGDLSALKCFQESLCSSIELSLPWLNFFVLAH